MFLVEGQVVPVFGPVTSRSNVCLTAGQMAIETSLKIADSRSLGQGFSVVREQGARVAHNSPH